MVHPCDLLSISGKAIQHPAHIDWISQFDAIH
jgi:hypothetical protein